jgi:hypothetical protein
LNPPTPQPPAATAAPVAYEPLPTLNTSVILQPQYLHGPNFSVRNPVPTYFGSNRYTIDSDFGVFEADGSQMLIRRVAESNAIAKLQAMSQTKEFTQAAAQAAEAPLKVAQSRVHDLERSERHLELPQSSRRGREGSHGNALEKQASGQRSLPSSLSAISLDGS